MNNTASRCRIETKHAPGKHCLASLPPSHKQIHSRCQVIGMRLQRFGGIEGGKACVSVATLFVILCAGVIHVGKGLVRVDDDEVGGPNPCVRQVRTETRLKNGKNGIVGGIDGRCA